MKKTKKTALKKKGTSTAPITKTIGLPKTRIALPPATMTEDAILDAYDMMGVTTGMDERTKRMFVAIAKASNLNPLRREIHAVERKKKVITQVPGKGEVTDWVTILTPVVGFEVFIDRAEQSGRLAYWNCITTGTIAQKNLAATVTIKRKDWQREFVWIVRHEEVSADNSMWKKEPTHMTEKVAISRAFRLCFRDVLRDMPYTAEEEASIDVPTQATPIMPPRALLAPAVAPDATAAVPVQHEEKHEERKPLTEYEKGLKYLEITETDSKSKHIVPLFTENERIDYTHELGQAKNNPEELAKTIADIIDIGKKRRAAVKGVA